MVRRNPIGLVGFKKTVPEQRVKPVSHQSCRSHTLVYDNIFGEFCAATARMSYETQDRNVVRRIFNMFIFLRTMFQRCKTTAMQPHHARTIGVRRTRKKLGYSCFLFFLEFVSRRSKKVARTTCDSPCVCRKAVVMIL